MYTSITNDTDFERNVMDKVAQSWNHRVAVRQDRLDLSQYYDASIPDFPISMVPFWHDEQFSHLEEDAKRRFLAAAWIAYNEKAIYLEDEIVLPLCSLLLKNGLPGVGDPQVKQVLAQTQVDEQFHILMCLEICNSARIRHHLNDYVMPPPMLGLRFKELLAAATDPTELALIRMSYATVAETTVHAYLKQISSDLTIQPLNRINTDMHRRDELAHSSIFREVAGSVYKSLDESGKACFRKYMMKALNDFSEVDLSFWSSILEQLQIPDWQSIMGRMEKMTKSKRISRDYTALLSLLNELGIKEEISFTFDNL